MNSHDLFWYGYCFFIAKQFYEQLIISGSRNSDHWVGIRILCFFGRKYHSRSAGIGSYRNFDKAYSRWRPGVVQNKIGLVNFAKHGHWQIKKLSG